ncbi:MAG TPA: macro domain-containing protein, partial [Leptospiraceae bacterium]|nr:macro domain-containing protein [Leptospiraceae bacterium]
MIHYRIGNILESDTDVIINTVNTVGVMGKGLALEFKRAFPENYKQYERAAKEKQLKIGKLFVTQPNHISIKYIVNFPTKSHWKERSKIEYIKDGLEDLVQFLSEHKEIKSI